MAIVSMSLLMGISKVLFSSPAVKKGLLGEPTKNKLDRLLSDTLKKSIDTVLKSANSGDKKRMSSTIEWLLTSESLQDRVIESISTNKSLDAKILGTAISQAKIPVEEYARQRGMLTQEMVAEVLSEVLTLFPKAILKDSKKSGSAVSNFQIISLLESLSNHNDQPSKEEALNESKKEIEYQRAVIFNQTINDREYIELGPDNPLEILLGTMVNRDWGALCRERLLSFKAKYETYFPHDTVLLNVNESKISITKYENWEIIRTKLLGLNFREINNKVQEYLESIGEEKSTSDIELISDLEEDIYWLKTQAFNPSYQRCLLFTGSWGSGKTRTITKIIEWCFDNERQFLLLSSPSKQNLETEIMHQANTIYGTSLTHWKDLRKFLISIDAQLFILIDEFQRWSKQDRQVLKEFTDLVRSTTEDNVFYWAVSVDEAHLDEISADKSTEAMSKFWSEYSTPRGDSNWPGVNGWINLDEINRDRKIGLKLIGRHGSVNNRKELKTANPHDQVWPGFGFLSNPLPAWICIELDAERPGGGIADANRSDFVKQYWNFRRKDISRIVDNVQEVEKGIALISRFMSKYNSSEPSLNDIVSSGLKIGKLALWPPSELEIAQAIESLRNIGLLTQEPFGDRELGEFDFKLRVVPELFWGYRIARHMINDALLSSDTVGELSKNIWMWGSHADAGDWLAENVYLFSLVILAEISESEKPATDVALTVWQSLASDPSSSLISLLLAGVWAPLRFQSFVVQRIETLDLHAVNNRCVFAIVRFTLWTDTPEWTPDLFLSRIQPIYGLFPKWGLSNYLRHTIDVLLRQRDFRRRDLFVNILQNLVGIEESGIAESVARTVVRQGWRAVNQRISSWSAISLDFLGGSLLEDSKGDFLVAVHDSHLSSDSGEVIAAKRRKFWTIFVKMTADTFVRKQGIKAFRSVVSCGWYTAFVNERVSFTVGELMKSEMNTALGTYFRNYSNDAKVVDEYVCLVKDLCDGRVDILDPHLQRMNAFYLMEHSVVTMGSARVSIDKAFYPYLEILWSDEAVREDLGEKLLDLLKANQRN